MVSSEQKSAVLDPAFANVGKEAGTTVFRIEKMQVVPVAPKEYGSFYEGDAYIIFHTTKGLSHNIHFWIGKKCSKDEAGTAAIKTVELDQLFGGEPVQYREIQEHESGLLMSYFKSGIRYLTGGVESGFKHVGPKEYKKVLYKIKGKRNCRIQQVDCNVDSLNKGDAFVLDCGREIYVWSGPDCSRAERIKGAEFARQLRDEERQGQALVFLLTPDDELMQKFFSELGSNEHAVIKEAHFDDDDISHEHKVDNEIKLFKVIGGSTTLSGLNSAKLNAMTLNNGDESVSLARSFRVSDASGKTQIEEVLKRPLSPKLLNPKDCYILDVGPTGIYAWLGKECTENERKTVWYKARNFLRMRQYPSYTQVIKVCQGAEVPIFRQVMNFPPHVTSPEQLHVTTGRIAKTDVSKSQVDVDKMRRGEKEEEYMPDDGSGEVQVWRVENFFLMPVDKSQYGTFYAGDSYVVMYRYMVSNQERSIIYFWQGIDSSTDEKAASAILTAKMDEKECHGDAMHVRVLMNKEPAHFLKIFNDDVVILMGGRKSGFKNINDKDTYDTDGVRLFRIRNNKIIQVPEKASSLNSNDTFVLETPQITYMWYGKGSSQEERNLCKTFAKKVTAIKSPTMINEGEESDAFWAFLGGKGSYATGGVFSSCENLPVRLFQCSNARGYFTVEEIYNFSQEDLIEDDVMILDAVENIYIWIGKDSNQVERKEATKTAAMYVKADPSTRTEETVNLLVIKQGAEPTSFTGHFPSWDPEFWKKSMSEEEYRKMVAQENSKVKFVVSDGTKCYPLKTLQSTDIPDDVDVSKKEYYLNNEDFQKCFNMTKEEYESIPMWKRVPMKKKCGLY